MYQTFGVALGVLAFFLYFYPDTVISKLPPGDTKEQISKNKDTLAILLAAASVYLYANYPDTLTIEVPSIPSIKTPSTEMSSSSEF